VAGLDDDDNDNNNNGMNVLSICFGKSIWIKSKKCTEQTEPEVSYHTKSCLKVL